MAMAGQNVKEFTSANWEQEVVQSDVPVLVDFWATWCGPCVRIGPIVDKVAGQFLGKLKVGKVNTDEQSDLAAKFGINSIPALLFFKGGQLHSKLVGALPERELVEAVNRVLAG
jgi:thioredoxin 1